MALTISTGFVVDDAIVMIENIARYVEEGEAPAGGGAQGRAADWLHHHLAHHFADCGADPAAVHGRRGGAAVPRVRHHHGGGDFDFCRGVAHAHAHAVRAPPAPPARRRSPAGRLAQATGQFFERTIARYGRALGWVLAHRADLAGVCRHAGAHGAAVPGGAQGLFPGARHGHAAGHHRGRPVPSRLPPWPSASRLWPSAVLRDPAVQSVSSFIGVDGTNTTLNTGRLQIDLKPHGQRERAGRGAAPPGA